MDLKAQIFKSKASRATLMKRADSEFSRWIRERDAIRETKLPPGVGRCITCNQPVIAHGGSGHAGHYVGRQHQATRYHEKNVHLQCPKCNTWNEGEHGKYAREIDRRYGPGTAENLDTLSRTLCKRTRFDFMMIIHKYLNQKL